MKTDTLLTVGLIGLGGYVLYKWQKGLERAGEGVGDIFEGAGTAFRDVGQNVGTLADQITRTTELVPYASQQVRSGLLGPAFSEIITPSISNLGEVSQDVTKSAGDVSKALRSVTRGGSSIVQTAAKVVTTNATQSIRSGSSLSKRSGVSIDLPSSTASIKIPVSGGYQKITYTAPTKAEIAQKTKSLIDTTKKTASSLWSGVKKAVSKVSKSIKR